MSDAAVVIPARFGSTRLPGKPLLSLAGKPMIQWVYERATQISPQIPVYIATDDQRIADAVHAFGGKAVITPADIRTGSERVGLVAQQLAADIVVNLQGDEPLISPAAVARAIQVLREQPDLQMATLGAPLNSVEEWRNPSVVKLLTDQHGNAIFFSRAAIPFHRDTDFRPLPLLRRHIGVYVFRRSFLLDFLTWPEGVLEAREKLEQLRVLEHGYKIHVVPVDTFSPGVDTKDDIEIVESMIKRRETTQ